MSINQVRYKRPESVLVVVISKRGKVLLLKRVDHDNFWQSVTGSMAWEETDPFMTARRELREETGIEIAGIEPLNQVYTYEIFPQWRHRYAPGVSENQEHSFCVRLDQEVDVNLNPEEHSDFEWLDFSEALRRVVSWSNRDAIALVQKLYFPD